MKQLIVNADDFGYTPGVNRAIVEASLAAGGGIITATSLLANGPAFQDAVALAARMPGLDIGCHLNLVEGRPVCNVRDVTGLVDGSGNFAGANRLASWLLSGRARHSELEAECAAQVERLLAAGIQPSHLDTHQHTHLHPRVARAVAGTARRYGIAWVRRPFESDSAAARYGKLKRRLLASGLRVLSAGFDQVMREQGLRTPDHFSGFILTGRLNSASLRASLALLPEGTTELMCHPGYSDESLAGAQTNLQEQRQRELEALREKTLPDLLRQLSVRLTSYRDLCAKGAGQSGAARRGSTSPEHHVNQPAGRAEAGRI